MPKESKDSKIKTKEKPKKEDHKKRNIIFIISGIILILVIIIIIILGIRISFIINDELIIKLDPLDKSLTTKYGLEKNITISFENYNSFVCKSECSYKFTDISSNKLIDNGTLLLKSRSLINKTYSLKPSIYGSGQEIYLFEVRCHNINSFSCSTNQDEYIKSSFITLSYELNDADKESLNLLNNNLNNYQDNTIYIDVRYNLLKDKFLAASDYLIDSLFYKNYTNLNNSLSKISSNHYSLLNESNYNLNLWFSGNYNILKESLKQNLSYYLLFNELTIFEEESNKTISYYNDAINRFEDLANKSSLIDSAIENATLGNNSLLLDKAKLIRNDIIYTKEYFKSRNSTLKYFNERIISVNNDLDSLLNNITTYYNYSFYNELINDVPKIPYYNISYNSTIQTNISLPDPVCCLLGKCRSCCTTETCSNDPSLYPIIFIHGHSFNKESSPEVSLNSFTKIKRELQSEGFINAGQLDLQNLESVPQGEYGKSGNPITISASYYYINYYDLGSYKITTQKSERIENYALRLNEIINIVKQRTNAKKVVIVSHSMGGLVAREYLRIFGDSSVDKLVMIATPNYGISGRTKDYCSFLGSTKECEDMTSDSIFLKRLNQANTAGSVKMYTIAGSGCLVDNLDSDGVAYVKNVALNYSTNYIINGTCSDALNTNLHQDIIDPYKYPKTLDLLKEILKK